VDTENVPTTSLFHLKTGFISLKNLPDFLKSNIDTRFDKKTDFTAYKFKNIHFDFPFLVHLSAAQSVLCSGNNNNKGEKYLCLLPVR